MRAPTAHWSCPACGNREHRKAFHAETAMDRPVDAADLSPTASAFGTTVGTVVRCTACRHGSMTGVRADELEAAYAHVEDGATAVEEVGQLATARRDLAWVLDHLDGEPGRLLDIGCWTGSLVAAAGALGWDAEGLEPSRWAVEHAVGRGLRVRQGTLGDDDHDLGIADRQVVTCCDVLEHLVDPGEAAARIAELLQPGGLAFVTVPDAGSVVARLLGSRWWSVLPMHVQYFTRGSLTTLLEGAGFEVVDVRTHPKVFTRRYYADRLASFAPVVGPFVARRVASSAGADRPFAPDFRDRIAIIARRSAMDEAETR